MKDRKADSKNWHFDLSSVGRKESDKIREQIKDGIPSNMFVIRGNRIICGGDEELRHEI